MILEAMMRWCGWCNSCQTDNQIVTSTSVKTRLLVVVAVLVQYYNKVKFGMQLLQLVMPATTKATLVATTTSACQVHKPA